MKVTRDRGLLKVTYEGRTVWMGQRSSAAEARAAAVREQERLARAHARLRLLVDLSAWLEAEEAQAAADKAETTRARRAATIARKKANRPAWMETTK